MRRRPFLRSVSVERQPRAGGSVQPRSADLPGSPTRWELVEGQLLARERRRAPRLSAGPRRAERLGVGGRLSYPSGSDSTTSSLSSSKRPGRDRFSRSARASLRCSKSCVTPPGTGTKEPRLLPLLADEQDLVGGAPGRLHVELRRFRALHEDALSHRRLLPEAPPTACRPRSQRSRSGPTVAGVFGPEAETTEPHEGLPPATLAG